MHVHKLQIQNFRLLENVELLLEERSTVIVGRNNSGKTSLTELFRRLLSESSPRFRLEDFSLSVHEDLWFAFVKKSNGEPDDDVRKALPCIAVKLTIKYEKESSSLGPLGDFIIDLDPDSSDALIAIRYELKSGAVNALFEGMQTTQPKGDFFRVMKERVPNLYTAKVLAVDPTDSTNEKEMDWAALKALVHSGFINAQRGLDDITHKDRDVLGRVLEALLNTAMSESADAKDRDIANKLEGAVKEMQTGIDKGFNKQLADLLPAFSVFGYPGLVDPGLMTETTLDVKRLLTDHTKVHYAGVNGINLPESYNGLGVRNLIFILLKLLEYFKSFMALPVAPVAHLVFIEEPEVHLHPQMQQVFIRQLGKIAETFVRSSEKKTPWPVQFVVTTHSTHMANEAPFDCTRYFLASPKSPGFLTTKVKDLRTGLGGTKDEDRDFLHKYMTLTRCDLLFADKAILIEGTTERLLLPRIIGKVDDEQTDKLASQYVSIVEVGGAYAHRFFNLLEFLELRTLIITDLDSVDKDSGKCIVSKGTRTSNGCIKAWFGTSELTTAEIVTMSDSNKISGIRRLAYQVPEVVSGICGRSFEGFYPISTDTWVKSFSLCCCIASLRRCRGLYQRSI